jgi:hypothetical protein
MTRLDIMEEVVVDITTNIMEEVAEATITETQVIKEEAMIDVVDRTREAAETDQGRAPRRGKAAAPEWEEEEVADISHLASQ